MDDDIKKSWTGDCFRKGYHGPIFHIGKKPDFKSQIMVHKQLLTWELKSFRRVQKIVSKTEKDIKTHAYEAIKEHR